MNKLLVSLLKSNNIQQLEKYNGYFKSNLNVTQDLIIIAATCGNLEVLKYLCEIIKADANSDCFNSGINKLLVICSKKKSFSENIFSFLLENGADININNCCVLRNIIKNNNYEMAKFSIKNGAIVGIMDHELLSIGVQNNNLEMVKLLVESGVELSNSDPGYECYYEQIFETTKFAYNNRYFEILKYLIDNKADMTRKLNILNFDQKYLDFHEYLYEFTCYGPKVTAHEIEILYYNNKIELLHKMFNCNDFFVKELCKNHSEIKLIKKSVVNKYKNLLFNKIYENNYGKDIRFVNG